MFKWLDSIRSLATLMLIATYSILCLKGIIKPEDFQSVILVIITFYFVKKRNEENKT